MLSPGATIRIIEKITVFVLGTVHVVGGGGEVEGQKER